MTSPFSYAFFYDFSLVGGIPTPLKNMNVRLDHHPVPVGENKIHVPNHQPVPTVMAIYQL